MDPQDPSTRPATNVTCHNAIGECRPLRHWQGGPPPAFGQDASHIENEVPATALSSTRKRARGDAVARVDEPSASNSTPHLDSNNERCVAGRSHARMVSVESAMSAARLQANLFPSSPRVAHGWLPPGMSDFTVEDTESSMPNANLGPRFPRPSDTPLPSPNTVPSSSGACMFASAPDVPAGHVNGLRDRALEAVSEPETKRQRTAVGSAQPRQPQPAVRRQAKSSSHKPSTKARKEARTIRDASPSQPGPSGTGRPELQSNTRPQQRQFWPSHDQFAGASDPMGGYGMPAFASYASPIGFLPQFPSLATAVIVGHNAAPRGVLPPAGLNMPIEQPAVPSPDMLFVPARPYMRLDADSAPAAADDADTAQWQDMRPYPAQLNSQPPMWHTGNGQPNIGTFAVPYLPLLTCQGASTRAMPAASTTPTSLGFNVQADDTLSPPNPTPATLSEPLPAITKTMTQCNFCKKEIPTKPRKGSKQECMDRFLTHFKGQDRNRCAFWEMHNCTISGDVMQNIDALRCEIMRRNPELVEGGFNYRPFGNKLRPALVAWWNNLPAVEEEESDEGM